MATLVLGAVGSAVGGALLPGGVGLLGTAITGAALGSAVGAVAGGFIDQALLGPLAAPSGQSRLEQGPRLADVKLGASSEGAPLPRVYGRARLPGQLIWATRFKEEVTVTTQRRAAGRSRRQERLRLRAVRRKRRRRPSRPSSTAISPTRPMRSAKGRSRGSGASGRTARSSSNPTLRSAFISAARARAGWADHLEAGRRRPRPAYRGTAYVVFEAMALERFGTGCPAQFRGFRAVDDFEKSSGGRPIRAPASSSMTTSASSASRTA